jgi:hypothetical protein
MRILVFMSDNRPLTDSFAAANYNSLTAAINTTYCKRHGYDFAYFQPFYENPDGREINNCRNPVTNAPRHAAWSKLLSALNAMNRDYDYYVYIDSDCVFRNPDITLESTIAADPAADVIFMNDRPWHPTMLCSGFFILKNTRAAREFIMECYNTNFPHRDTTHNWEQDACRHVARRTTARIHLVDTVWFDEKEGQQLRHVGSHQGHLRIGYFRGMITEAKLDYAALIHEIPLNVFSTKDYIKTISL